MISEFLTNAVRHAEAGPVSLSVRLDEQSLRIEVCDDCPELPRPGLPDPCSESGRGLFLVAALTDRYGVEPTAVAPVPVTIGLRPPTEATGTLPVPISAPPVPEGTFRIIGDLDVDVAESAGCSCSAGDDQPYWTGAPLRRAVPAVRWEAFASANAAAWQEIAHADAAPWKASMAGHAVAFHAHLHALPGNR
ncbi:ATP-binding protein [Streptomyces griseoincarnatus]|uniref:ATP-binding protein n=1 Tax=unclassified Streptomyces TaxID=2593676 RepID=UPI0031B9D956